MDHDQDPQSQFSVDSTDAAGDDRNASYTQSAQYLEVVFDAASPYRRKSSMSMNRGSRPSAGRRRTSCFVHGLLQEDQLSENDSARGNEANLELDHSLDKALHGNGNAGQESRLLTKGQLADMAFSIRELSKRLGRFKLKIRVRNVFLLTKAHDETLIGKTREVAHWLLSQKGDIAHTVYAEDTLENNKIFDAKGLIASDESFKGRLKFWTNELCLKEPHTFDIILALGGDGTVLYASWLFQRVVPPVLSFALGSLGFLTKFNFEEFRVTLTEAFNSGLTVSLRLRLEATVMRSQAGSAPENQQSRDLVQQLIGNEVDNHHTHKPEQSHDVLNDLVLDRGPNPTMSSLEVFGDNYHITTVQADGVCVATPTGSTAYNLAAGGSLCHPDNPVVLVTAICAHTLSFRPIVLPDTIVLRLGVPYNARASSWVSFDGKERTELNPGDYVTISASRFPFPTVLPLGHGSEEWIDSLSKTLNWNSRKRQKSFKEWKEP